MVNRQPHPIAILDENTDGDYSDLANTTVLTDVASGNGERNEQAIHSGRSALALGGKFYTVSEIARDGSSMTLKEAVWGQLKGATDQTLSDVLLRAATAPATGRVQLNSGDSYDFLGQAKSQYSGGDFYFTSGRGSASFYANNRYQKGMVDLGMLGNMPLKRVVPPAAGYSKYGVSAALGHTYVSNAKDGEDGHFIIFRVVNFGADGSVELDYYYR
jgi:hypothetical protein